eukprot:scaffold9294_cov121-Isochrysis_galbana.AAC.3
MSDTCYARASGWLARQMCRTRTDLASPTPANGDAKRTRPRARPWAPTCQMHSSDSRRTWPEWRPVKRVVRDGAQTVYPAYAASNVRPLAASASRCGVEIGRAGGGAAGPDPSPRANAARRSKPTSPMPRSSAMIHRMFGAVAATVCNQSQRANIRGWGCPPHALRRVPILTCSSR